MTAALRARLSQRPSFSCSRRRESVMTPSESSSKSCRSYFDKLTRRSRSRNWLPLLLETLEMELNGLPNEGKNLFLRFAGSDTARKVWDMCPVGRGAFFDNHKISHGNHSCFSRPACLSALFNVPGGMSTLVFPDTVTVPVFVG